MEEIMSNPPTDTATEFEIWIPDTEGSLVICTHSAYVAVQQYAERCGFRGTWMVFCRELPDGEPVLFEVREEQRYRARPIEPSPVSP